MSNADSFQPYVPPYKNMDKFKGEVHHTAVSHGWFVEDAFM